MTNKLKNRVRILHCVNDSIPLEFNRRNFLIQIFGMDLKYNDNPCFSDTEKLKNILSQTISFDPKVLQSTWNSALADVRFDESMAARRVILSSSDEMILFLQYNYSRLCLSQCLEIATERHLTLDESITAAKWGDCLKSCRDTLIVSNLGLIFSMGRHYRIFATSDINDVLPEGIEALMRSVDRFDIELGFKFSTYACRAVVQGMNRQKSRTITRLSKEFPSSLDITPSSKVSCESVFSQNIDELRNILSSNTANLTEKESYVLDRRFFEGARVTQLSNDMLITKEKVRKIQSNAISKIRNLMVAA